MEAARQLINLPDDTVPFGKNGLSLNPFIPQERTRKSCKPVRMPKSSKPM
jgi:hypothetical protein